MSIKKFIEKAIQGGYKGRGIASNGSWFGDSVFLIPEVWQAVGKVEGWYELNYKAEDWPSPTLTYSAQQEKTWLAYMHRMIDALAEGKTIEQYLETL